jgi:hypothetical protein
MHKNLLHITGFYIEIQIMSLLIDCIAVAEVYFYI